jgi:hypothetical protein
MSFAVEMALFAVAWNAATLLILIWMTGATKLSKKVEADREARFGKE